MKYYSRLITKREKINSFGKLGYIAYTQYVKTNNVERFNKGLKVRFYECEKTKELIHAPKDTIIEKRHDITSSEAYFRKKITYYR